MVRTIWKNYKFFVNLHKDQVKVNVKTTGLVHNFIILANFWTYD